ncbi:MAG: hypothetical protein U9Q06_01790 [Nanoarchaeota archaeon]|nr:hypothetical protein [Nanoarchaeota archaeon]
MLVKRLVAKCIKDTRDEDTIEVYLRTEFGKFKASAPNGKSRGKYEVKPWKKSLKGDIKFVNSWKLKSLEIKKFDDLINLEKLFKNKLGSNTMIAIEYVFLRALAREQKCEIWQLINSRAHKMPRPVGNLIGGGAHSFQGPDIQEFLAIPFTKTFSDAVKLNKKAHKECRKFLKKEDRKFKSKKSDENAWCTSLSNLEIMRIMVLVQSKFPNLKIGMDVAASEFYKNKLYKYKNKKKIMKRNEQIKYISELGKIFYYIEDGLDEEDFKGFEKINSKGLIVGDDLTVTSLSRLKRAKSGINAIIIKPNQCGSLIEVKKIVKYCKSHKIKIIFSHRSGETSEDVLSDLAFGFGSDFIKTGVLGKGREEKLKRLVKIEKSLM